VMVALRIVFLESAIVNAPDTVEAGRNFLLTYSVTNYGSTPTPNTSWTDDFYLSADSELDVNHDTQLAHLMIQLPPDAATGDPGGLDVDEMYIRQQGFKGLAIMLAPGDR